MKVDLHFHTTASDGRLSPEVLVRSAAELGFDIIAITDHDTVDGIAPALSAAQAFPRLQVIPGIEINTDVPDGEVHILGYFIDYVNPVLCSTLPQLHASRWNRALKMVAKLHDLGLDIDWHYVQELAQGACIGRPHVAQALLERGYAVSIRDAFAKYIGHGGPAYVERMKVTPTEAVKLITTAQGLPVLAHPADIGNLRELLNELECTGLIGLEVFYNGYSSDIISNLLMIADEYKLVPTGGSDFHGLENESMAGLPDIALPRESVERLFTLAGKKLEL